MAKEAIASWNKRWGLRALAESNTKGMEEGAYLGCHGGSGGGGVRNKRFNYVLNYMLRSENLTFILQADITVIA